VFTVQTCTWFLFCHRSALQPTCVQTRITPCQVRHPQIGGLVAECKDFVELGDSCCSGWVYSSCAVVTAEIWRNWALRCKDQWRFTLLFLQKCDELQLWLTGANWLWMTCWFLRLRSAFTCFLFYRVFIAISWILCFFFIFTLHGKSFLSSNSFYSVLSSFVLVKTPYYSSWSRRRLFNQW